MRILSIETSGRSGSVALLEGEGDSAKLAGETRLAGSQRTAQVLAPAIRGLFAAADWPADSIELVAVVVGPGSFTGLRIGVTTAKTLAYAVGAAVVAVNTLDVLAAQAPADGAPLWTVIDAQRQELFAALFDRASRDDPMVICKTRIVPAESWLAELQPGEHVTGPALRRLKPRLPAGIVATAEDLWQPTASAAGQIAWRAYQAGRRDDLWTLVPQYYRPSAAEEKEETRRRGDKETC